MLITNNWHYLFTITGLIFHNSFKEGDCVRLDLCKAVFLVWLLFCFLKTPSELLPHLPLGAPTHLFATPKTTHRVWALPTSLTPILIVCLCGLVCSVGSLSCKVYCYINTIGGNRWCLLTCLPKALIYLERSIDGLSIKDAASVFVWIRETSYPHIGFIGEAICFISKCSSSTSIHFWTSWERQPIS